MWDKCRNSYFCSLNRFVRCKFRIQKKIWISENSLFLEKSQNCNVKMCNFYIVLIPIVYNLEFAREKKLWDKMLQLSFFYVGAETKNWVLRHKLTITRKKEELRDKKSYLLFLNFFYPMTETSFHTIICP